VNAEKWFLKSAERGHPLAQYNLGFLYSDKAKGRYKPEESFQWYMKSAQQGDHHALYQIGKAYELGLGIEISYEDAFIYYAKSIRWEEQEEDEEGSNALRELIKKRPESIRKLWYLLFRVLPVEGKQMAFELILALRNYNLSKDLIMRILNDVLGPMMIDYI